MGNCNHWLNLLLREMLTVFSVSGKDFYFVQEFVDQSIVDVQYRGTRKVAAVQVWVNGEKIDASVTNIGQNHIQVGPFTRDGEVTPLTGYVTLN